MSGSPAALRSISLLLLFSVAGAARATTSGFVLEVQMASSAGGTAGLYYDIGQWYTRKDSVWLDIPAGTEMHTYRFAIPAAPIKRLRFDPASRPSLLAIGRIRLTTAEGALLDEFGPESLRPMHHIESFKVADGVATVKAGPDDPMLLVTRLVQPKTEQALDRSLIGEPAILLLAAGIAVAMLFSTGTALRSISPHGRPGWLFWSALLVVFGVRLAWLLGRSRSIPYWDEWEMDGVDLLIPLRGHFLDWGALFVPQSEHRTLIARLLVLAGTLLNGEWDPRVGMVFGAAACAASAAFLCAVASCARLWLAACAAVAIAALSSFPIDTRNLLCGDQCSMYTLNLMAVVVLLLSVARPSGTVIAAAAVASTLSLFTMASGCFAPLLAAGIAAAMAAAGSGQERRRRLVLAAVFLCAGIAGLLLYRRAPFQGPAYAHSMGEFLGALVERLSWPLGPGVGHALLVWFPWLAFAAGLVRPKRALLAQDGFLLGLGAWVIANAAALAHGRPSDHAPFDSKYYTSMLLAVVCAVLALVRLAGDPRTKLAAFIGAVLAIPVALAALGLMARSPGVARAYWQQSGVYEDALRPFLRTGDPSLLYDSPPDRLPYWNGAELGAQLDSPLMQPWLPAALRKSLAQRPDPVLHGEQSPGPVTRACRLLMKLGGLMALAGACLFVAGAVRGRARDVPGTQPQAPSPAGAASPGADIERGGPAFSGGLAKWVLGLVFLALAANWVAAVGRFQVNVLYWDQWGFFTPVMEGKGWWGLFDYQHGPHRQGVAFLFTSWIMGLGAWDARIDSLWICFVLFAAAALALLLKRRIAGPLRAGDAWILLAVLALGQWETVITTPNASHSVFPLLLTLVLAHLWLSRSVPIRYLGSGLFTGFLMFTGFGIFAAGVSTVFMGLACLGDHRAGRRRSAGFALAAVLFSLVCWGAFSWGYVFNPASPGFSFPWTPAADYLRFIVLMMAAPAGWDGATVTHYVAGLACLVALLLVLCPRARSFLAAPSLASADAVLLLLGVGALLFCADSAVGRVHLGPAAGLASRYVTLVTPAWLAGYLWAAGRPSGRRLAPLAFLWALVLCPYLSLLGRPAAQWIGSMGAPRWMYERMEYDSDQKLTFVAAYLRQGDARLVEKNSHSLVIPDPLLDYLEPRLAFQRSHRLSFFAHPDDLSGYAPWFRGGFLAWLSAYPAEGTSRWIGEVAELEADTRADGYVNFRLVQKVPALPSEAKLDLQLGSRTAEMDLEQGLAGVSLPVSPGRNVVSFRSPGGAFVPGGGDPRSLSFSLSEPTLTSVPLYIPWVAIPGKDALSPAYDLRIISGFYGWEGGGSFGWASDRLELSAAVTEPAFLNVAISERLQYLPQGPVVVSCGDFRREFEMASTGLSFSLALSPRSEPYRISIVNSTGAAEPKQYSDSKDGRLLALRFTKLGIAPAAEFQRIDFPLR